MKNKRHIQIKIWPEIINYYPAFIPFEKVVYSKENPIDLDFSNATEVKSSSLTLILIEILKIIRKSRSMKWIYREPENEVTANRVKELGLLALLYQNFATPTLFWDEALNNISKGTLVIENNGVKTISYPIHEFNFQNKTNEEKRKIVEEFREMLFEKLDFLFEKFTFKIHKLIQVITEMAKNSADHSYENAYFGLDINMLNNILEVEFVFGDMGIGINKNVRNAFLENPELDRLERAKHLGLVETYHFALTPGLTTKLNSKINRGIGMTIILDVSKDMGIELSVFDAESRGVLSRIKEIKIDDLRKNFYNLNKEAGFYYYGKLTQKIFSNDTIAP